MSAKDFIELAGYSIDEGRSHWDVHKEIDRRILELESLKTDMAMMKIVIADLETENLKLTEDSVFLEHLHMAGVDNWEGYGVAMETMATDLSYENL
jgi:hypothetical protein